MNSDLDEVCGPEWTVLNVNLHSSGTFFYLGALSNLGKGT